MTNLNDFLNTSVGRRLMKIAEAEQTAFNNEITLKREQLQNLKDNMRIAQFGTRQNTTSYLKVEGNLCKVETDMTSHIKSIEPLTQAEFKQMSAMEQQAIKQVDAIIYNKLKYGSNVGVQESEKFFNMIAMADEFKPAFETFELICNTDVEDWTQFENSEDRNAIVPISKEAKYMDAFRNPKNVQDINNQILELERNISDSIAAQEIIPLPSEASTMEGDTL
ncbi:hypothetical protein ACIGHG_22770 [Bacillus sp. NPDC077411]|uniref:hypothetical protein n=1 Tax=Bacillus sp. NPDC077411 TaxID=3363947 RepID=UPI0037C75E66